MLILITKCVLQITNQDASRLLYYDVRIHLFMQEFFRVVSALNQEGNGPINLPLSNKYILLSAEIYHLS